LDKLTINTWIDHDISAPSLGRLTHPFEIQRDCDGIIAPCIVVFDHIADVAKPGGNISDFKTDADQKRPPISTSSDLFDSTAEILMKMSLLLPFPTYTLAHYPSP
jgi:hypothetical protein